MDALNSNYMSILTCPFNFHSSCVCFVFQVTSIVDIVEIEMISSNVQRFESSERRVSWGFAFEEDAPTRLTLPRLNAKRPSLVWPSIGALQVLKLAPEGEGIQCLWSKPKHLFTISNNPFCRSYELQNYKRWRESRDFCGHTLAFKSCPRKS